MLVFALGIVSGIYLEKNFQVIKKKKKGKSDEEIKT
jgi:hypothetical protein